MFSRVVHKFVETAHRLADPTSVNQATERLSDDWRIYGHDGGWNNPRVPLEIGQTEPGSLVVLNASHEVKSRVDAGVDWLTRGDQPQSQTYAEHELVNIPMLQRVGDTVFKARKTLNPGVTESVAGWRRAARAGSACWPPAGANT